MVSRIFIYILNFESSHQFTNIGQTHHIELDDVVYEDWAELLTLNIRLTPTRIFEEVTLDEPELEDTHEFPWHCNGGIVKHINKVNEEFNRFHNLSPMKIAINGPPASGKTYYGSKLSEMYDIPHIKISDIVSMVGSLPGESGDEIRKFIDTKKDETMEEFEKSKKKGQELSRDDIVVRLPDNHIHTLTKIKLSENTCRNKGYILDGFPKTYIDCYHTFYNKKVKRDENGKEIKEKPQKPEGEGEQEPPAEGEGEPKPTDWENDYELATNMLPKVLIQLSGTPEEIKARVKELPEDKTHGTHWDDAGLDRRNGVYNQHNTRAEEGEEDKKLLIDFYNEHKVTVFKQNCLEEEEKVTESLKKLISENFTPASIQTPETESDQEILQKYLEGQENGPAEEESKDDGAKQQEEVRAEEAKTKSRLEKIKEQERELLDARSQPIRQYLMDKVVPLLTEGLIKICKEMPEKPTGDLADFLFKRCDEIDAEEAKEKEGG